MSGCRVTAVAVCLVLAAAAAAGPAPLGGAERAAAAEPAQRAQERRQDERRAGGARRSERRRERDEALTPQLARRAGHALRSAAPVAARYGIALALLGGTLLALRTRARRRRRMVRYSLVPFSNDEAGPELVRRLLETWHQQLLEHWRTRPFRGQPALGLEVLAEPDGQGGHECRLVVAVPERMTDALESGLRSCYPNCRLVPRDATRPPRPRPSCG